MNLVSLCFAEYVKKLSLLLISWLQMWLQFHVKLHFSFDKYYCSIIMHNALNFIFFIVAQPNVTLVILL